VYVYDPNLYQCDKQNQQDSDAEIKDGAILYRIASLSHWEKTFILSGQGAVVTGSTGRFHRVHQQTSYCANNVIVCLSEVLYHMYRQVLKAIDDGILSQSHIFQRVTQLHKFVIFSVSDIDNLVYVDSIDAKSYDRRIISTTVVYPDPTYGVLHKISDEVRMQNKNGVIYPSARHSVDLAFAFFKDETAKIKTDFYEAPLLKLQLIAENQIISSMPPTPIKPFSDKLHATIGYYEFMDAAHFQTLDSNGLLYPAGLPVSGYVDFVRRQYSTYPRQAYLP
jgi:RES domain-containing protein